MSLPRIAIVHDWLTGGGGAEQVLRELLYAFPEAELYALVDHMPQEERDELLHGRHARTTFIQGLPFSRTHHRWYLPLFPRAMERLDLRQYDLVISASYAVAKGVRKRADARHLCYLHTPMRYAWVDPDTYLIDHGLRGPMAALVRWQLGRLRTWDLRSNAGIDRFVANGPVVAERVERYYQRHADVLLPPVDVEAFHPDATPRKHYLTAARLVPYKRSEAVVRAFALRPQDRLVVCGDGPERERLQAMATPNVHFTGHVPRSRLAEWMRSAHAFICAANEDLGLTPLEAQASGTPVIALDRGGYRHTVAAGISGHFFPEATPEAIHEAIDRFTRQGVARDPDALREHVLQYRAAEFRERIRNLAAETMQRPPYADPRP